MATKKSSKGVEALGSEEATEETKPAPTKEEQRFGAKLASEYDEQLRNYQNFDVKVINNERMGPEDHMMRVGNVPADRCVTWATDPRFDNGRHVSMMKQLGFREVRIDEVSHDAHNPDKLHVKYFDEGRHETVAFGGGILMVGYLQYRNQRRAAQRARFQQMLDDADSRVKGVGVNGGQIEVAAKSKQGSLKEVGL